MADGSANAIWLRSAKWYESKKGEFSTEKTERQACGFIGCGSAIIPKGSNTVAIVKEYTRKSGEKSYVVQATLALYNNNYIKLISWGDNDISRTISNLEKDDHVFVAGKEVTYPYTNRKGERVMVTELQVFFIMTQSHVSATESMYMNQNIQMLMNGNMPELGGNSESDEFESAAYDEDEYENESEFDLETDEFEEPDPMETPWR